MAELKITRNYKCSVSELWSAWTDSDQYSQWIAADPWKIGLVSMDVRPGGVYKVVTIAPDGSEFTFSGQYLDVTPNEQLSNRGDLQMVDGTYVFKDCEMTVTMREVSPGIAELTLMNSGFETDEFAEQVKDGWEQGGLMDLERFLANSSK